MIAETKIWLQTAAIALLLGGGTFWILYTAKLRADAAHYGVCLRAKIIDLSLVKGAWSAKVRYRFEGNSYTDFIHPAQQLALHDSVSIKVNAEHPAYTAYLKNGGCFDYIE